MKKVFIKISVLVAILCAVAMGASAQVYVQVRPVAPVIVRPPQPSAVHVWIGDEWEPNAHAYKDKGGHWAAPPHHGYVWVPGRWNHHNPEGDYWIQGSWKKG
jgi:hypothetical protein